MEAIVRIILRYGLGALASAGYLAPETAADISVNPDVLAVGCMIGAGLVELWYWVAKKKGRAT